MITRHTKKMGIIAFITLTLSAGVLLLSYQYLVKTKTDLGDKRQEIANYEAHKQSAATAEKTAAVAAADQMVLEEYVLAEAETVDFLTDLENMATTGAVALTTESLKVMREAEVPHISLRLTGIGEKTAINNFLDRLEALPYISWLEKLTWSRTEEGIRADIVLNIVLLAS